MANMGITPGGGRQQEPIQNWYAYDAAKRQQGVVDPLAKSRSMFAPMKQNTVYGTQPVGGNAPESPSYHPQPRPDMPSSIRPGAFGFPPPMRSDIPQMGNPTGYQPMGSGQFSPVQMRANPYMNQSNWYGQMAFNPQMYGGGAGFGFGGQFQGMNPYASMQQLQQWRNPYVNNMLSQGYLRQPQQYSQYTRPQMPGIPTMPQMPQFQAWNPYYNAQMGMPPGQLGSDK